MLPKNNHPDLVEDAVADELTQLRSRLAELAGREMELDRKLAALQAREYEYRTLLDESSDPIFMFYPDGHYRYVNTAFAQGVGRKQEDIIGRAIWDVFPKEEADKRYATVDWVFRNNEVRTIEVRVPRPDGDHYYLTTVKPINTPEGKVVSVICISKDITERRLREEQFRQMAYHDALTVLPNRTLFFQRLDEIIAQAQNDKTGFALMFVDLDGFKEINDSFGHDVGDQLLQEVATRLQVGVRQYDVVARMGGDEFAIILRNIGQSSNVAGVAANLLANLRVPYHLADQKCRISGCIGISCYPEHGVDAKTLLKRADAAMYSVKRQGKNGAAVFSD